MERTIENLKKFEVRNNTSVFIEVYSDGSSQVKEFWNDY